MMISNLLIGVVFVIFVLSLSVGFRNAMLAIVGVPFSFLAALVLFPYFDITINSLSIIGFVMVSGMLVDDAIIILENIYRHIEEGVPLKEAAVRGAEEVMWPVIAAVATTMAAFIPMLLITGPSGEFMSILPKTVIVCLLGSLFEALIVLPAHYVDFGSRHKASDPRGGNSPIRLFRASHRARLAVDRAIDRWRSRYLQAQAQVLEHRWSFVGVSLAALFFAVSLSSHVGVDLFPSDFNMVIVTVDGPPDSGIDQMEETMQGMEGSLGSARDELTDVMSFVGFSVDSEDNPVFGENLGVLYLTFPNNRKNAADPTRILNLVRAKLEHYRDANSERIVTLRVLPPRNGPPIGTPVAIRIQSENYAVAKEIAEEIKAELANTPGVFNIDDNLSLGPRELRVKLDPHRASIHGLAFEDVGVALMAANEGLVSSTFKDRKTGEDVDIRVLLREDQRRSISDLLDVSVRTPDGYRVKLGDVAKIEIERGYEEFYHYDAQRAVVVYAEVDNEQATSISVNSEMEKKFSDLPLRYPGVDMVYGGEYQMTDDSFAQMRRAFILALIAIYGILAAQFRSYVQPIVVMSVIGFSFIGVIIGIYLLDYSLSMFVIYAMVGLAGIVVNDSLVLIDFINKERARGTSAIDAITTASGKRFRPILLTTVTTVAGLLPMALGVSGKSVVYGPFAAAIVFGLSVASILTLFLVPSLYLSLEKASESMRARLVSPKPKSDPAQASLV
jgi:HAE1 family hydrophobic/amphiphilic exporter-1